MPNVFDTGWAGRMISLMKKYGDFVAVVSGTIGAVAMMDAHLEGKVNIIKEKFSDWINRNQFEFNVIVNVMHVSDVERMLAECWHIYKRTKLPIVGVETNSRVVAYWSKEVKEFAEALSNDLAFELKQGKEFGTTFWREGGKEFRRVLAVVPGDWIMINKIIVGKAEVKDIVVICEDGKVVDIEGAKIKWHGIEKLGKINLSQAKIDTVKVLRGEIRNRRTDLKARIGKKIAYVEHAGYDILKLLDCGLCSALTVGDDTTTIVGDVLSRFGIPIIGIIDGDADGLIKHGELAPGSIIYKVRSDDEAGNKIFEQVFEARQFYEGSLENLKERITGVLGEDLISISRF